jgi:hypothetical protein
MHHFFVTRAFSFQALATVERFLGVAFPTLTTEAGLNNPRATLIALQ